MPPGPRGLTTLIALTAAVLTVTEAGAAHQGALGDRSLRATLAINGHPMGSVVPVVEGTPLRIEVTVADANEPGAHYWVSLRRDVPGGEADAGTELFGTDYHGDGRVVFLQFRRGRSPEYFLVEVTRRGAGGTDVLWTAPIWLVAPGSGRTRATTTEGPAAGF